MTRAVSELLPPKAFVAVAYLRLGTKASTGWV